MPAPRKRCHNPACEYLCHDDMAKMGSFCCKKCHHHFCIGNKQGKKLQHGELCEKLPAAEHATVADFVAPAAPLSSAKDSSTHAGRPSKWQKKSNAEPYRPRPVDEKPIRRWMPLPMPMMVEQKNGRARRHGSRQRSLSQSCAARGKHEAAEDHLNADGHICSAATAGARTPLRRRTEPGRATSRRSRFANSCEEVAPSKPSPRANAQMEERIRALFAHSRIEQDAHETDSTSSESSASVYLHAFDEMEVVKEEPPKDSSTESDSYSDTGDVD